MAKKKKRITAEDLYQFELVTDMDSRVAGVPPGSNTYFDRGNVK